jgi:tRNA pseudouridine38-40 synthase
MGVYMDERIKNLKMIIAYEGTAYAGFQIQKNGPTIQAELETAIGRITGEKIHIHGAGRTDAGVHAKGQVVHFPTQSNHSNEKFKKAMNSLLPADIIVKNVYEVPMEFHAQYSARNKTYCYRIYNSEERPVFERNFVYYYRFDLNILKMHEAIPYLIGEKDFKSFQASGSPVLDTIRIVNFCNLESNGPLITFTINANGFLYHMVRNIVGTLILIGREKLEPSAMEKIILAKDRGVAGPTAPAIGLCLEEVMY